MHLLNSNPLFLTTSKADMRKGDKRKIEIIIGAIECLTTIGAEKCNFESIGKSIDLPRSHICYYFKNIDELIINCGQYCNHNAELIIIKHLKKAKQHYKDQIRAYINGHIEWVKKFPKEASVIQMFLYHSSYNPSFREINNEMNASAIQRFIVLLGPFLDHKKLKDTDINSLVFLISNFITSSSLSTLFQSDDLPLPKLKYLILESSLAIIEPYLQ